MKRLFFVLAFLDYSKGCAKTSESGIVDTTIAAGATTMITVGTPTTSDTIITTTTTSCSSCSVDNFNANIPDPNDPNSPLTHSADKMAGTPQNGCSTLVVTCTALPENGITSILLLSVDSNPSLLIGDPNNPPAMLSTTLVCNTSGQWQFQATPMSGASCSG